MRRLLDAYLAALKARPLLVNATTGGVLAALGDVAAQKWEPHTKDQPINMRRTFDMSLIRACVLAPFISLYFPWLARTFPGTTYKAALTRVAADQAIGSPISIVLTFASAGVLQGRPGTILERIQEQAAPAWRNGVSYWPFVHFFNFLLVPVHHQPLVAHAASLWWNAVLSHRSFIKLKSEEAAAPTAHAPTIAVGVQPDAKL